MKNFIFALFFGLTVAIAPLARADLAVFATVPEWGALAKEIGGDKVRQVITVRHGVSADHAKKIVRLVKDSRLKLQASIQGDAVRVSGAKRDDLQTAIALLKKEVTDVPLSFTNFRD